jgi:hypothetical protein
MIPIIIFSFIWIAGWQMLALNMPTSLKYPFGVLIGILLHIITDIYCLS